MVQPGESIAVDVDLAVLKAVEDGIVVVNILDERLEIVATFMSSDARPLLLGRAGPAPCPWRVGPPAAGAGRLSAQRRRGRDGGRLAWDAVKALPGFRMSGEQGAAWLRWPERPGVLFQDQSKWR